MEQNTEKVAKKPRYSISVSSGLYDRLRAVVPPGGLAGTVDEIIKRVLDDPEISAELVVRCQQAREQETSAGLAARCGQVRPRL